MLPPIPSFDGLHPLVVHFPVALLIVAPLFLALAALFAVEGGLLRQGGAPAAGARHDRGFRRGGERRGGGSAGRPHARDQRADRAPPGARRHDAEWSSPALTVALRGPCSSGPSCGGGNGVPGRSGW